MIYNKTNLTESIAKASNISKSEAERQLNNVVAGFEELVGELKPEDKIQLVGFLTLECVHKKEHSARNPRTKEEVVVKASNKLKIKPGKELVDSIKQPK